MATNKIKLCSEALVLIGHTPLTSLAGATAGAIAGTALYDATIDELLALHRWRFCSKAVQLDRLADAPLTKWEAAYQIPAEAEILHGLQVNGYPIEYDRFENELHCDAQETDVVVAVYGYKAEESRWPAYFDAVVRLKLAAQFALTVTASAEIASIFEGKFVRQLTAAKLLDSQGQTARKLPVGGLARYHQGRP